MRNLRQYPITDEEILKTIDAITHETLANIKNMAPGDSRLAILQKLKIRFTDLLSLEHEVNNY